MNPITKVGIAIGTLGGISGLGYIAIQQFTTKSIANKLTKEKYELLDSSSNDWTQILTSYKETIKTKEALKFNNFDGTATNALQELKRLCNEATKLDLSKDTNNTTYNKAKKWCTKPRPLTSILEDKGHKMLNNSAEGDHDSDLWDIKLESHQNRTENADKKFSGLQLLTGSTLNKDKTTRDKLREKCRPLGDKKHYEQEFEKELEQAILWCSKRLIE